MDYSALFLGGLFGAALAASFYYFKVKNLQGVVGEHGALKAKSSELEVAVKLAEERAALLADQAARTESDLRQTREESTKLVSDLSAASTQCEAAQSAVGELKGQADRLTSALEEKQASIDSLQKDVALREAELRSKNETVQDLKVRLEALRTETQSEISRTSEESDRLLKELHEKEKAVALLDSERRFLQERLETQKAEVEDIRKKFEAEFSVLANKILEGASSKFTQQNKDNIEGLLKPLGLSIETFKKKVEDVYAQESKERFSLGKELENLVAANMRMSEEANNLTKALEGSAKTQGDWGEMILERILEKSGLTKGQEYLVQEFLKNPDGSYVTDEDGHKLKPDVVIMYPDARRVIIDSKVSLVAYKRWANATDDAARELALKAHIASLRKHIDDLSAKNYQDFAKGLDFVMMFVPIEPAYLAALHADQDIWSDAYQKRVVLISPTNLIIALRMVADLWKREYQNRNAIEIADRGGKLYDKLVGFVKSMQDVGEGLGKAQASFDKAMGQLSTGGGNVLRQAEQMKALGAKAKASLPDSLLALSEGESDSAKGNGQDA
jgi:DNA recombination protein RmuC